MAIETMERILQAAEDQVRIGGYNAFSFRGIAKEVGIKSSSIHHYFPTKEDLGAALAKRYTSRFITFLEAIQFTNKGPLEKLSVYIDLFRQSLSVERKMCLCGVFAAEIQVLPEEVREETKHFFQTNLIWLTQLFEKHGLRKPEPFALNILALLEGAMLLARTFEDEDYFNRATQHILPQFKLLMG